MEIVSIVSMFVEVFLLYSFSNTFTLHEKQRFSLRISKVNVNKSSLLRAFEPIGISKSWDVGPGSFYTT